MKATNLLIEHHVQLKSTFNLLLKGNGHSAQLREKLATNLTAHMVIEQEIFYPAALIVNEELILDGYERIVEPGGPALMSARAPSVAHA